MEKINLAQKSPTGYPVDVPKDNSPSYPCVYLGDVGQVPDGDVGDSVVLYGKIKSITKREDKDGRGGSMDVEVHEMEHGGGKDNGNDKPKNNPFGKKPKSNNGNHFGQKRKDELAIDSGLKASEKKVENYSSGKSNGNSKGKK